MNANELMIGDWVQIRHPKGLPDANGIQISEIDSSGHSICFFSDIAEGELTLSLDDIAPIPLTPEILEKNGFTYYGESWYLPNDKMRENESIMISFYMYKTIISVKKGDNVFQKEVNCSYRACVKNRDTYVHQLQHALRVCGIDKTIKL